MNFGGYPSASHFAEFLPSGPAPTIPSAPSFAYWLTAANIRSIHQSTAQLTRSFEYVALDQFPQTPPPPAVGSSGIQLFITRWDAPNRRRLISALSNLQTVPSKVILQDNPQYWDYWNALAVKLQRDAQIAAQQKLVISHLSLYESAQTPPNKPDNPQYWDYWNTIARLQTVQQLRNQSISTLYNNLLQWQSIIIIPLANKSVSLPPHLFEQVARSRFVPNIAHLVNFFTQQLQNAGAFGVPVPFIDNPQYWDYWNTIARSQTSQQLTSQRLQTFFSTLNQYPQVPPLAPRTNYGGPIFAKRSGSYPTKRGYIVNFFTQMLQNPGGALTQKPDDPQYWAYWQLTRLANQLLEDFRIRGLQANILGQPRPAPPPKPDNPRYWDYWNYGPVLIKQLTNRSLAAHLELLLQQHAAVTSIPLVGASGIMFAPDWNPFSRRSFIAHGLGINPAVPPPVPDNPQYWAYWNALTPLLRDQQKSQQLVKTIEWMMANEFSLTPPPAPDNPQYWDFISVIRTQIANRLAQQLVNIAGYVNLDQPSQVPPRQIREVNSATVTRFSTGFLDQARLVGFFTEMLQAPANFIRIPILDIPEYWDYWTAIARLQTSRQSATQAIQALSYLSLSQYPQPPAPLTNTINPQYWAFWQLTRTNANLLDTFRAQSLFGNQLVGQGLVTLPPKPDNPQYWDYWNIIAAKLRLQQPLTEQVLNLAKFIALNEPAQTPPPSPDNPQYWDHWNVARIQSTPLLSTQLLNALGLLHVDQFPQTAGVRYPDDPFYWDFWSVMAQLAANQRAQTQATSAFELVAFHQPAQTPPNKPDNPQYWDYWNIVARVQAGKQASDQSLRTSVYNNLFQYPSEERLFLTVPDPHSWAFWQLIRNPSEILNSFRNQALLAKQIMDQSLAPPPRQPDDPQYWAYWSLTKTFVTHLENMRARSVQITLLQQSMPATLAPVVEDPQYWDYWNVVAKLQADKQIQTQQIRTFEYLSLSQYAQTPPPKPDNPQYWAFWQTVRNETLNNFRTQALRSTQLSFSGLKIIPDDPQYWAFWQVVRNDILDQFRTRSMLANQLGQPAQPPPPVKPIESRSWDFWSTTKVSAYPLADFIARALLANAQTEFSLTPIPFPDDPQYWAFWQTTRIAANTLDDFKAHSQGLFQLISRAESPSVPDTHQTWQYWLTIPTIDRLQRETRSRSLINLIIELPPTLLSVAFKLAVSETIRLQTLTAKVKTVTIKIAANTAVNAILETEFVSVVPLIKLAVSRPFKMVSHLSATIFKGLFVSGVITTGLNTISFPVLSAINTGIVRIILKGQNQSSAFYPRTTIISVIQKQIVRVIPRLLPGIMIQIPGFNMALQGTFNTTLKVFGVRRIPGQVLKIVFLMAKAAYEAVLGKVKQQTKWD